MTVLVALADDPVSDKVLDAAVRLGTAFEEPLYVVHLTDREHASNDTRRLRDETVARLEGRGVEFSVAIEHASLGGVRSAGAVGRELAELASDVEITHIVTGHTSKALFERLREGTTAFTVADSANVPVTVVPEEVDDERL